MSYQAVHSYPELALGISYADAVKQAGGFVPANTVPGMPDSFAWAPKSLPKFNPADYDAKKFAKDQATRWASAEMKKGIDYGRNKLSEALKVPLPALPGMSEAQIATWTAGYLQERGLPQNWEDGARMATAFAHAEAEALGVQPEWIAAADAIMHPPQSVEQGIKMVEEVGKAYLMKYGVPLLQQELMSLSSNLAMVAQGIPVQFAVAGFNALKDGKLTKEEIAGIAVMAASYACGLLLQAVGVPAPLGALIGAVIATGLGKVADDVIHAEDSDQRARKAATDAALKLRGQLMAQCAALAPDAWNKTQDYWDKVLKPIQSLMDQPDVQKRLIASGGVRYYGRNTVTLPPGILLPLWYGAPLDYWQAAGMAAAVADAEKAAQAAEAKAAPYRKATLRAGSPEAAIVNAAVSARIKANNLAKQAAADAKKPLYEYGFDCLWWEGALDYRPDPSITAQIPALEAAAKAAEAAAKAAEASRSASATALRATANQAWAAVNGARMNTRAWLPANARPFPDGCLYYTRATPKTGGGTTPQKLDPSTWQLGPYWPDPSNFWERCAVAAPPGGYSYGPPTFHASLEDEAHCRPVVNGKYTSASGDFYGMLEPRKMVVRVTPYSDHKSAVVTKTVTVTRGAMVDGKPNAQAALMFWGANRPATIWSQLHLPNAAEDASDEGRWKAFAYIDPNLTYSKSSATLNVPSDYCDVSQWYEAVQIAAAASALVQQDIIRTVAWQVGAEEAQRQALLAKQAGGAALIAQQAKKALLQAKVMAAVRAQSGAYSTALKARLAFQEAKAAAARLRKALVVVGLAAGAFAIWKVASKRKAYRANGKRRPKS